MSRINLDTASRPVVKNDKLVWKCTQCSREGTAEEMSTLDVDKLGLVVLCSRHARFARTQLWRVFPLRSSLSHIRRHPDRFRLLISFLDAWREKARN